MRALAIRRALIMDAGGASIITETVDSFAEGMNFAIKALMVDVDGVLIDGRPEDRLHWQTSVEQDFGFSLDQLYKVFFKPYWKDIIVGRAGLMERLTSALAEIAPQLSPAEFLSYWLEKDSRLSAPLLQELAAVRSTGIRVYLATNQEHLRAAYLMGSLGLAEHVEDIFYSAKLGAKKPDADFFTKVQASIGLSGEEILLVDDSLRNVVAAQNAGWKALHWTSDTSPTTLRCLRAPQLKPRYCEDSLCFRPEVSTSPGNFSPTRLSRSPGVMNQKDDNQFHKYKVVYSLRGTNIDHMAQNLLA